MNNINIKKNLNHFWKKVMKKNKKKKKCFLIKEQ